jgi:simple sugar transport system ATP-binding protein
MKLQPLVEMKNISMTFGYVQALTDVDFKIFPGEVIGLVGDNGAGKSTLLRILCGMYTGTKGEIFYGDEKISSPSTSIAEKFGINVVHQGFGLVEHMNVARNLFLGKEPCIKNRVFPFFLDLKKMRKSSNDMLMHIGLDSAVDSDSTVGYMSGGEKQSVKIGRCFFFKSKLIILDEPTIGLSVRETGKILKFLDKLKEEGVAIIIISHDIYQVYNVVDRIVILERGNKIADFKKEEKTPEEIIKIIRGM